MPDRVLRDEIWSSDRFLDLPTDVARLAFIRFLSMADDFGNFEGGPRRLYRILHACTMIKTEDAAGQSIDALMQADLIRRYEVDGRELFHIPKLRPHRQYLVKKMPDSPWDVDANVGKNRRVSKRYLSQDQSLAKNIATTSLPRSNDVAEGIGIGIGIGEVPVLKTSSIKQNIIGSHSEKTAKRPTRLKTDWKLPKPWGQWAMEKFPQLTEDDVRLQAENFRDYWIALPGQRGVKLDWYATWRNWIRNFRQIGNKQNGSGGSNWWMSNAGIDAKGREIGLTARGGENYESYKARIFEEMKAMK